LMRARVMRNSKSVAQFEHIAAQKNLHKENNKSRT
jgi:hypothetical protein